MLYSHKNFMKSNCNKKNKLVDHQPGKSWSIKINLLCGYLDSFSLYVHLSELFALHRFLVF